ncbi:MAG: hypothetical protein ACRC9R_12225 [Enterovibrio sp.]
MKLFSSKQRGVVVLWVVLTIAIIAAVFVFTTVHVMRDSVKKVQNQVQNERDRASLQSSLLCAAATFEVLQIAPDPKNINTDSDFAKCKLSSKINFSLKQESADWLLSATDGVLNYGARLVSVGSIIGSFSSAGDLRFDIGSGTGGGKWQGVQGSPIKSSDGKDYFTCNIINVRGQFYHLQPTNHYRFENANDKCEPNNYRSVVQRITAGGGSFKQDVKQKSTDLQLFQFLFGTEQTNWKEVQATFDTVLVTGMGVPYKAKIEDCGKNIKAAIDAGKRRIWVQGDCSLDGLAVTAASLDINKKSLIVIQDGVFTASLSDQLRTAPLSDTIVNGTIPVKVFNVSLYQFVTKTPIDFKKNWGWTSATSACGPDSSGPIPHPFFTTCSLIHSLPYYGLATLPFYFPYSFHFTGSLMIDIPGSASVIPWYSTIGYYLKSEQVTQTGSYFIKKGSFYDM